jgi:SAM-dependent methyltransferase
MMLPCHSYQHLKTAHFEGLGYRPIGNFCCKEDAAQLGKTFGAVNLDVCDFDIQERVDLYSVPNFIQASVLDMPFADKHFKLVILGEFLEHCTMAAAKAALREVRRVMTDDAKLVVTVPLDPRPKHVQHAPEHLVTYVNDGDIVITSWHVTVWDEPLWSSLLQDTGFEELQEHHQDMDHGFCPGFGAVLQKSTSV